LPAIVSHAIETTPSGIKNDTSEIASIDARIANRRSGSHTRRESTAMGADPVISYYTSRNNADVIAGWLFSVERRAVILVELFSKLVRRYL
jgi:hypothetical protein